MAKKRPTTQEDELFLAIVNRDLKKADSLIKSGANVNHIRSQGLSLLAAAVNGSNVQMTQLLIASGADLITINHQDENGFTPLHLATKNNNFPIVRLLLINDADVDRVDNTDSRPIDYARDNPRITRILEDARKKALKEELGDIFNESNLKDTVYEFHKDGRPINGGDISEMQERMTQTKREAMTIKEAMLGKNVVALQDIQKKDKGAHVGARGGAGAGRRGSRG